MDISCEIIRDLLPLYAENLTSKASNDLVDKHLCECDDCTKQLGILKKAQVIPVDVEVKSLKRVGDTIRRRRILAAVTVLLLCVTIVLSAEMLLDAKIYLTAEQAVKTVEQREDGAVIIYLNDNVMGMGATQHEDSKNYGTIAWSTLSKQFFHSERVSYEELDDDYKLLYPEEEYEEVSRFILSSADGYNVWYCDARNGKGDTLLMDGGNPTPTGELLKIHYDLMYYCVTLMAVSALLAFLGWKFKDQWYGELCTRISVLLGCLCLSAVMVTAGQFAQHYSGLSEQITDSTIVAVPMTLTALFARQLYKLNKQDKGQ